MHKLFLPALLLLSSHYLMSLHLPANLKDKSKLMVPLPNDTIQNALSSADSLFKAGDYNGSIEAYQNIHGSVLASPSKYDESQLFYQWLNCLVVTGNTSELVGVLNILDSLMDKRDNAQELQLISTFNKGSLQYLKGNYLGSIKSYHQTLDLLENQNDESTVVKKDIVYNNLGIAFTLYGDLDSADYSYDQSIKSIQNEVDDISVEIVNIQINRGLIMQRKGDYQGAAELLEPLIPEIEKIESKDSHLAASVLLNYGYALNYSGAYQSGAKNLEASLAINAKNNLLYTPPNIIHLLFLSEAYFNLKEIDKADSLVSIYMNKIDGFDDYYSFEATGIFYQALVADKRDDLPTAIEFYRKALALNESHDFYFYELIQTYNNLMSCLFAAKDVEGGLEIARTLEAVLKERSISNQDWINHKITFADYLIENNEFPKAMAELEQALDEDLLRKNNKFDAPIDLRLQLKLYSKLAIAYAGIQDTEHDTRALSTYYKIDSLANNLKFHYASREDKLALSALISTGYSKACELSVNLFNENRQPEFKKSFYYFLERNKSFNLFRELKKNEIVETVFLSENNSGSIIELKKNQEYYQNQLLDQALDSGKVSYLKKKILKIEGEINVLESDIQGKYADQYSLVYNSEPVPIDQVSSALAKEDVIISYLMGIENTYGMFISADTSYITLLEKSDTILSELSNMNSLLKDPLSDPSSVVYNSYSLYKKLIMPFAKDITGKNLIISPDQSLYFLPFEMLVSSPAKKAFSTLDYLIKSHDIRYIQSLTLMDYLSQQKANDNNGELLAFSPEFSSLSNTYNLSSIERASSGPLNYTSSEVENISQYFTTRAMNQQVATEENLKKLGGQYGIIHLATHALVNDQDPLYSKILFNATENDSLSDGMLHSFEILNLGLNAEMVVLSACNSGVGKVNKGEGVMSLASSFFYSGAKSVVMSQWPANDLSTSKLMGSFYKYLEQGKTKSAALRQAKIDYLDNEKNLVLHPYYWSQFVVYGKNTPIEKNANNVSFILLAVGAILFLVLIAYVIKRYKRSV